MIAAPFIVLEGPEGAGKSVQARLLADWLREQGLDVVQTREPGGTPAGDAIRQILLQSDHLHLAAETEALLMAASRSQHVHELLLPSLRAGKAVVCDRYVDSSYAYQGGGRGLGVENLRPLQEFATAGLDPTLRVLLDLPVEVGLARRHSDLDQVNRIDRAPNDFHEQVRDTYLALAQADPHNWVVIDASADVETVAANVRTVVEQRVLAPMQARSGGAADS